MGPTTIARWAASICTSAASSTPYCTCCTPGSGTRCCTTWATCQSAEPFHRLVNQGMSRPYAYTDSAASTSPAAEVVEKADGARSLLLRRRGGHPRVRQDRQVAEERHHTRTRCTRQYGADTFRLFEMFTGPLEQYRPWDAKAVIGSYRLLQRIWRDGHRREHRIDACIGRCAQRATESPAAQDDPRGPRGVTRPCGSTPRSPASPN